MLVLRKEVKLGLGVGAAAVGIAAVYGLMAVLSANSHTPGQSQNPSDDQAQVATDTASDSSAVGGLPPTDDSKTAKPQVAKAGGDPFLESARTDGNKSDPWEMALRTGRVQPTDLVNTAPQPAAVASNTTATDNSTGPIVTQAPIDVTPTFAPSKHSTSGSNSIAAPSANDATASFAPGSTYKVQPGDTFSKIAAKTFGDKRMADAIMKANPTIQPTRLRAGQTITLPAKEEVATIRGSVKSTVTHATGAIDTTKEYRVSPGDTLNRIAVKLYGRRAMWEAIYDANKSQIGSDPAKLKVGEVLKLPKEPTRVH